ncbi:MAG: class I SAM-dependent methyltransferase [Saprospiraceae bacterium]
MQNKLHQLCSFLRFYAAAQTRYQVHSPFVFEWVNAVLEDRRWFYAFDDIEALRRQMLVSPVVLDMEDYGAVSDGVEPVHRRVPVRQMAVISASSPAQGRMLFRTVQWLRPQRLLEIGTSIGVGGMYLASAARQARLVTLEGSAAVAHVAQTNFEILNLHRNTEVRSGPFRETLALALESLGEVDLVFFDGRHREAATLDYFERCLPYCHGGTALVFDDLYWSAEMTTAWEKIKQHERVTATIDCFDLGFAFLNPDIGEKQHFKLMPFWLKPWKVW